MYIHKILLSRRKILNITKGKKLVKAKQTINLSIQRQTSSNFYEKKPYLWILDFKNQIQITKTNRVSVGQNPSKFVSNWSGHLQIGMLSCPEKVQNCVLRKTGVIFKKWEEICQIWSYKILFMLLQIRQRQKKIMKTMQIYYTSCNSSKFFWQKLSAIN